jgi:hypothetical protein
VVAMWVGRRDGWVFHGGWQLAMKDPGSRPAKGKKRKDVLLLRQGRKGKWTAAAMPLRSLPQFFFLWSFSVLRLKKRAGVLRVQVETEKVGRGAEGG